MTHAHVETDLVGWSSTALGRALLEQELLLLAGRLVRMPGSSLLWLGYPGNAFDRALCMHAERTLLLPNAEPARAVLGERFTSYVSAQASALPFATASMQAVVVQHAFDFTDAVHGAVREAARVLQMGGQLIVVGFNPFSLWGARRSVQQRWRDAPWCGRQVRLGRMTDWLQLLGFRVLESGFAIRRAPFGSPDPVAQPVVPGLRSALPGGAVYMVHVRKEGYGVNPLRQVRKAVPVRLVPAAAISARARSEAADPHIDGLHPDG
jgi:hypothetical protein